MKRCSQSHIFHISYQGNYNLKIENRVPLVNLQAAEEHFLDSPQEEKALLVPGDKPEEDKQGEGG